MTRSRHALLIAAALGLVAAGPKGLHIPKQLDPPAKPPSPPKKQQADDPRKPPGDAPAAVLKHARAATALVVLNPTASATAFCINPAGLFVTHRRAIDAAKVTAGGTVTLVVDAGEPSERRVPAKVIRENQAVALLQAEDDDHGPAPFHALPLSDANGPGRDTLWAVAANGFPTMAVDKDTKVPAPAQTAMWCWARYKPAGHWHSVHLESAVPAGATGGPVVGYEGRVVGVLDEPDKSGQVTAAAPAADVWLLGETPVISVRPGPPDAAGRRPFTAAVFTALGKLKSPAVTLELGTGPTAVTVPMTEAKPGAYTATAAVPAAADGKPVRYRVTVTDGKTAVGQTDGHVDAGGHGA